MTGVKVNKTNQNIIMENGFLTIKDRPLILKLRSLGAGIEEADETKLALLEAAYFADRGVLPLAKDDLIKEALKSDPDAIEKYHVIRYLRNQGYIVRPSLDSSKYLRLHRKGYRPGEDKTYYLIAVTNSKKHSIKFDEIYSSLDAAGRLRKELTLAIVDTTDEDKEPTFIKFSRANFE